MNTDRTFIYLHGLCSSPGSKKAQFFKKKLSDLGIDLIVPDLNVPSFEQLTISAQLEVVKALFSQQEKSNVLIGSSLGGLLSLILQYQLPKFVDRVVLIAPAVSFLGKGLATVAGTTIDEWKKRGYIQLLHYKDNRYHKLGFQIVEDARQFDFERLEVLVPTLAFHGKKDEVVPFEKVKRFMERQSNVRFVVFEDGDHSLLDYLAVIWSETRRFLGL